MFKWKFLFFFYATEALKNTKYRVTAHRSIKVDFARHQERRRTSNAAETILIIIIIITAARRILYYENYETRVWLKVAKSFFPVSERKWNIKMFTYHNGVCETGTISWLRNLRSTVHFYIFKRCYYTTTRCCSVDRETTEGWVVRTADGVTRIISNRAELRDRS